MSSWVLGYSPAPRFGGWYEYLPGGAGFVNAAPPVPRSALQIDLAHAQRSWKGTDGPEFSGPVRGNAA
jgi:hypothetical protein